MPTKMGPHPVRRTQMTPAVSSWKTRSVSPGPSSVAATPHLGPGYLRRKFRDGTRRLWDRAQSLLTHHPRRRSRLGTHLRTKQQSPSCAAATFPDPDMTPPDASFRAGPPDRSAAGVTRVGSFGERAVGWDSQRLNPPHIPRGTLGWIVSLH